MRLPVRMCILLLVARFPNLHDHQDQTKAGRTWDPETQNETKTSLVWQISNPKTSLVWQMSNPKQQISFVREISGTKQQTSLV